MKRLPTWVEVDLDRFEDNLRAIRRMVGEDVRILLTVKADAYGHGAVQVAEVASAHVSMLGVATLDEGVELKESGAAVPILILSPVLHTEIQAVASGGFSVTVSSRRFAEALSAFGEVSGHTFSVHVEVDTGMGRTGIPARFAREEIGRIAAMKALDLEGVYTHFPVSDTDPAFTGAQVAGLLELVEGLEEDGVTVPIVHSANSAAVAGLPAAHMNMVRPGLLAYGLHPAGVSETPGGIGPVLAWKSRVARVRRVRAGDSISYGRDFVTKRESWIGVVPVGYGHGYPFRARGGEMLIGGHRVPVVGRVTMDMTMVDLTDLPAVPDPGEEVVLVGTQGGETISFHDLAAHAGSICYEIMCNISKRVPRTYFRAGRVQTYKSLLGILPNQVASRAHGPSR
jgi:alanine racemase